MARSSLTSLPAVPWWRRPIDRVSASAATATGRLPLTFAIAVATCAATPAYVIRWHLGPLPTTFLENAVLLTIVLFALESWNQKVIPTWRTVLLVPALLFLLAGAISVVDAPSRWAALGLYRAYLIEPIAFGLVVINIVTTPRRAMLIGAALALGGTVAGLANAAVVFQALRHHTFDVVNNPPVVIYNTTNAVALFLVPVIAFASAIALHWNVTRERLIAAGFAVIGTLCVLLSFSRGGYLALVAVGIGLALSHPWRWRLLAGGVVAIALLMLVPAVGHRVLTELDFSNGHNTLVGRSRLWLATLHMLRDHPILGAGLSGFATVFAPYWNPTNIDRFTYPHNIVLNFWTETGLLGLAAFLWILVVGFVMSWRGYRRDSDEWRFIHLGVLLALVAIVVHGLVDVPYWKNDLSLEFWTLMGLTLARAPAVRAERR